jgi:hypothetical protein
MCQRASQLPAEQLVSGAGGSDASSRRERVGLLMCGDQ